MSRREKLVERFKTRPSDFTWDEMVSLLRGFGYVENSSSGSSRRTFNHANHPKIKLHKPHPHNVVKMYAMDQVKETLEESGLI